MKEHHRVSFNDFSSLDESLKNINNLLENTPLLESKSYTYKSIKELSKVYKNPSIYLTHTATGALEMISMLIDIQVGDEVILPSYTFVSTVNAFVSRGAIPRFVDIDPVGFNMDVSLVEAAITPKTKAIVIVHYGGHACDMSQLKSIASKHRLYLIEDAAMAFGNTYRHQPLGTIGDFGVVSFDNAKQISSIQGGMLLVNHHAFKERASSIYHIGTNRDAYMSGEAPYYEWVDIGSKFQMSELNAAVLYAQLLNQNQILQRRKEVSKVYYNAFRKLEARGTIRMVSEELLDNNFHEFFVLLSSKEERLKLSQFLSEKGIESRFHYIPLHNSKMGRSFSEKKLPVTEDISNRLLRLPFHSELSDADLQYVSDSFKAFFK